MPTGKACVIRLTRLFGGAIVELGGAKRCAGHKCRIGKSIVGRRGDTVSGRDVYRHQGGVVLEVGFGQQAVRIHTQL